MDKDMDIHDIDWNLAWKRDKLNSTWRRMFGELDTVEYWNRRAESFNRNLGGERAREMVQKLTDMFRIGPDTTILDIGAGAGRLAVPLARIAGKVTAIEPSSGMLGLLVRNAEDAGLDNITGIMKRWEDIEAGVDVGKHDLVLACHSLGMLEIRKALTKMNMLAEKYVCIYDFGGRRVWDFSDLWPRLYGEEFVPGPCYIYLVNLLYSMGINANVEVKTHRSEQRYGDMDEALKETKIKLGITGDEKDGIIRNYLEEIWREENGELVHTHDFEEVMLWWQK